MTTTYENLVWRETQPGVWQREVGMLLAITGHLSITVPVCDGDDLRAVGKRLDNALRNAWLSIRYDHPTIASQVTYAFTEKRWIKTYRTAPSAVERDRWLDATFIPISTGQTGEEFTNSDPPPPKLPTLFVVAPKSTSYDSQNTVRRDLVLRAPHDIIDGTGTLHFFNNLVTHASRIFSSPKVYTPPAFDGSEAINLSPAYRIAAAVPPSLTEELQAKLDSVMSWSDMAPTDEANRVEPLGFPCQSDALLPGKHQRVAHTFSKEQSGRIIDACKALGMTVTHVFHAAIALSLRDVQHDLEPGKRVKYVHIILRNVRPSCLPPYNSSKHAVAVYLSIAVEPLVIEMTVPDPSTSSEEDKQREFLDVVEKMKEQYHRVRDDPDHYALVPYILGSSTPPIPESVDPNQPLPVPPPRALPSVSLSSLGVIDRIISAENGSIGTDTPWAVGEELGNGLGMFLGTFRGRLCFSAAYNEAWHDEGEVRGFIKHCEDRVLSGLCLE